MLLDVVLPFYGSFEHLRVAVESVLSQDDPDWRLIVIDDAYPDIEPYRWAAAIADPRVQVVRNDENLGITRNFNFGLSMSQAEHLVIMGADDVMHPGYVRRVRELIERFPQADLIQPGVEVIDSEGRVSRPLGDRVKSWLRIKGATPLLAAGEPLAVSLLRGDWLYFPSLVWHREALGAGFRTDVQIVEDISKIMDVVMAGGALALDDEIVFSYRRHRESLSMATATDGRRFAEEQMFFAESAARAEELGWTRAARTARRHIASRLHALTEVPRALVARDPAGLRALLRHAFAPTPSR